MMPTYSADEILVILKTINTELDQLFKSLIEPDDDTNEINIKIYNTSVYARLDRKAEREGTIVFKLMSDYADDVFTVYGESPMHEVVLTTRAKITEFVIKHLV